MVIFHSYVSLPEGNLLEVLVTIYGSTNFQPTSTTVPAVPSTRVDQYVDQ